MAKLSLTPHGRHARRGTSCAAMRPSLLCATAGVLALAGCGGGVSGDTPSGYETTTVHGASISYPKGWHVGSEEQQGDTSTVDIAPAGAKPDGVPVIKVLYRPDGGKAFTSFPRQFQAVYEGAANGEVTSQKSLDVDGADGAYLMTADLPGTGPEPQPRAVRNLQVRRGDATWIVIAERDPKAEDQLDLEGVTSSFKLGGGS